MATDNQNKIALWLTLAGKKAPKTPQIPDNNFLKLWKTLMLEELDETFNAGMKGDFKEFVDGLIDLVWVLNNATHMSGILPEVYQKAFDEVTASNFSKYCMTEELAQLTVESYATRTDDKKCEAYYKQVGNYWIVYRKSDNKILKGVDFREPEYSFLKNYEDYETDKVLPDS